ncbi:TerB family tellurite resistance protein [Alcanivorax quisquiliarum]|uniref:TerB family tellurite resistance protein n=1 Tax=Alcanivorax quisquiliarum TaxID=2933565 RepID=A0ABT0E2T0_9GAMM|nr:TerB family tellurite resistance protein [Alcanivorax quisquiliarum]MCK0536131.1 TerB family tellurite resistance protein [Alcanivorax quisquiliarum]
MLKPLLDSLFGRAADAGATREDLHRAAAALLYEVARADGHLADDELDTLMRGLQRRWEMDDATVRELIEAARKEAEEATDYFQFTLPLRNHWSAEQRAALIEDMWAIAHADGSAHPREEFVIRKVADLLYVPHSAFIRARHLSTSK